MEAHSALRMGVEAMGASDGAEGIEVPGEPGLRYPYGGGPLLPAWRSLKGRALAALSLACGLVGSVLSHGAGRPVNETALLAVMPGLLAFTLAFAPEPRTRLGTMAKDLLCLATAAACLSGPYAHLMLAGVPGLLALAVAMDRAMPPGLRVPARYRTMPREARA